jgi:hypothetical protein
MVLSGGATVKSLSTIGCAVLVICMTTSCTRLARKDFTDEEVLRDFFPGVRNEEVARLEFELKAGTHGYSIFARIDLEHSTTVSRVLQGATRQNYNIDPDTRRRLSSLGWWRLKPQDMESGFLTSGQNALSSSFHHWLFVPAQTPPDMPESVYLIGWGI